MSNYVPPFIKPYKYDIQQGNFITKEETAKLKPGMSKDEVRFVLGTPLLNDAFHADRWDYVFRLLKGDGSLVDSRYTVQFEKDKLTKFGGEGLPENQAEANVIGKRDERSRRAIEPVKAQPAAKPQTPTTPSAVLKTKPTGEATGGTENAPELK